MRFEPGPRGDLSRRVGARLASVAALTWALLATPACRHVTEPEPTAVGTPTASMPPEAIVEHYQSDPELGEELFDGKLVHIEGFRVDETDARHLFMRHDGFTLRIERPGDTKTLQRGEQVSLFCRGEGMVADKLIAFGACRRRL